MNTFKSGLVRMGFAKEAAPSSSSTDFGPAGTATTSTKYSQGIGSDGSVPAVGRNVIKEERISQIAGWIRNVTCGLFFLSLILAIALVIFQKKWIGALSGLSGFLLFCNSAFLLILIVFTAVPIVVERTQGRRLGGLDRAIREDRLGIIGHAFCVVLGVIVAMTQLISALVSKGCKNHADDPHAKSSLGNDTDYQNALTSFCNIKKAEAVFLWLGWGCCVALAVIFFREFKATRKSGPRIPPFHSNAGSEGAFQPLDGEDEDDPHSAYHGKMEAHQDDDPYASHYRGYDDAAAYDAPGAFAAAAAASTYQNPLSDIAARYGMASSSAAAAAPPVSATTSGSNTTPNPFADALAQAQPMMSYRMPPQFDPQRPDSAQSHQPYQQQTVHPQQYQQQQQQQQQQQVSQPYHGQPQPYPQQYQQATHPQQYQQGPPPQQYLPQQQQQQQQYQQTTTTTYGSGGGGGGGGGYGGVAADPRQSYDYGAYSSGGGGGGGGGGGRPQTDGFGGYR